MTKYDRKLATVEWNMERFIAALLDLLSVTRKLHAKIEEALGR